MVALPLAMSIVWRIVLKASGGDAWHTWITSERADEGPFVVALRAMFGMERGLNLRQNLANALIVNWLWVPALLALVTVVFVWRRGTPALRRAVGLIGGLAAMFTWTTLTFPTFIVPALRHAPDAAGAADHPDRPAAVAAARAPVGAGGADRDRRARRVVADRSRLALAVAHDDVGGERFYDTPWEARGPDRNVYNLALLRASERMNARLRRIFATDVDVVTGDCDSMKFGEKLFSVGFTAERVRPRHPGRAAAECIHLNQLPPDAATARRRSASCAPSKRTPRSSRRRSPASRSSSFTRRGRTFPRARLLEAC